MEGEAARGGAGPGGGSTDAEALFELHGGSSSNAVPSTPSRAVSATDLLQAVHFVPHAFRGSKWRGTVRLVASQSFSICIVVDGESARISFRGGESGADEFLVMKGGREDLLSMLEGSATPCMLVVSGALWVSNWEHALLFQEAFDFSSEGYAAWKGEQEHVLVRELHSPSRQLAGGADVSPDVEAALQHVLRQQGRTPEAPSQGWLGGLLCCAARDKAGGGIALPPLSPGSSSLASTPRRSQWGSPAQRHTH